MTKDDRNALLAAVVHELRAPLNACLMSVSLLELKATDPEAVLNAAAVIRRNLEREAKLIRDLGDVVQIVADSLELKRERVALAAVLEEVLEKVRPAAEGRGIGLESSAAPACTLETDPERLVQVLCTLLENLLAGAQPGQAVSVEARAEDGSVRVSAAAAGDDTGPVSDPETKDEARRREQKVFGIRLLVAEHLLGRLGGAAERGADAAFAVRLPLHAVPGP